MGSVALSVGIALTDEAPADQRQVSWSAPAAAVALKHEPSFLGWHKAALQMLALCALWGADCLPLPFCTRYTLCQSCRIAVLCVAAYCMCTCLLQPRLKVTSQVCFIGRLTCLAGRGWSFYRNRSYSAFALLRRHH